MVVLVMMVVVVAVVMAVVVVVAAAAAAAAAAVAAAQLSAGGRAIRLDGHPGMPTANCLSLGRRPATPRLKAPSKLLKAPSLIVESRHSRVDGSVKGGPPADASRDSAGGGGGSNSSTFIGGRACVDVGERRIARRRLGDSAGAAPHRAAACWRAACPSVCRGESARAAFSDSKLP